MPGVLNSGFEIKTFDQIKGELEENFQQIFGSGINLDSTSLLGQQIGIFSKNLYDLWQTASDNYQSRWPATAQGRPLDQLVAIAALRRKGAFRTSGQVYLLGEAGTTVPQGTILSTAEGAEVETNPVHPDGAVTLTAGTAPVFTLSKLPGVSSLTFSVSIGRIFSGFHGEELLGRSVTVTFTDDAAAMKTKFDELFEGEAEVTVTKAAGDSPITVTLTAPWFLPVLSVQGASLQVTTIGRANGASVSATALDEGPVVIPAGAIRRVDTPVSGLLHVTNFLDFVTGRLSETDSEIRTRWTNRIESAQISSEGALRSALQNISGVSNVLIFVPSAGVIDAVVEGGADSDIAAALLANKPVGTLFAGDSSEIVNDENGNPKTVRFSRPQNESFALSVSLESDADFPEDGEAQIRAAITEYQDSLAIGGIIRVSPDIIWALQGIRGINNLRITVNGSQADIDLEPRIRAVFSPVNTVISDQP